MFGSIGDHSASEPATGWSIKKFVRTSRCYRTVQIRVGKHTVTAEDPLPDDLQRRRPHRDQLTGPAGDDTNLARVGFD